MPVEHRSDIAGRGWFTETGHGKGERVVEFPQDVAATDDLGRLNHSCDPNLGWADGRNLATLRDVGAGEELTVDYATCIADADWSMYCHCETYRCRQMIEGTDWQIPQLQTRYAGSWVPAIQRLIDRAASAGR